MPAGRTSKLLDAFRSGDVQADRQAHKELDEKLEREARRQVGSKHAHVEFQTSSIVQAVKLKHFMRLVESAEHDDEMLGMMVVAVRREIRDRGRATRRRSDHKGKVADHLTSDIPDGPSTIVRRHEHNELEKHASQRLDVLIDDVSRNEDDRRICEEFLIKKLHSRVVGKRLDMNEGAVRTRASRLRPRVLNHMLDALRNDVDAQAWAIAKLTLGSGLSPGAAAEELEISKDLVLSVLREQVFPAVRTRYGARGLDLLAACRRRPDR